MHENSFIGLRISREDIRSKEGDVEERTSRWSVIYAIKFLERINNIHTAAF